MICGHLNKFAPFFTFNGIFNCTIRVCVAKLIHLSPAFQPCQVQRQPLLCLVPVAIISSVAVCGCLHSSAGYLLQKTSLSSKSVLSSEVRVCIHLFLFNRFPKGAFFYLYWFSFPFFLWLPRILELNFVYSYSSICLA